jgi:hypothetical protein
MAVTTDQRRRFLGPALVGLFLAQSACTTVRLVANYDEPTDRALTELQQETDAFLAGMMAGAPSDANAFDQHEQFYTDADAQLRRLEFRVASIPDNGRTVRLVALIRASILGDGKCTEEGTSLRDLHCFPANRARGPSRTALEAARRNVNQTIGSALALEIAKKQGLEPSQ